MLSVIVPTYNRCASLNNVLRDLLKQDVIPTDAGYEIIVVDNNSTDGTKHLVESFMNKADDRIKYCFEPVRGRGRALNHGIRKSRGEIIAFTDDDVFLDSRWLFHICVCFKKYSIDALGGRVLPAYPQDTPFWIKDKSDLLQDLVIRHDYGEDVNFYDEFMEPFVGANMAIQRSCVGEDPFENKLGVGTGRLGEDTELFRRLRLMNKKILYCGKALIWHPVDRKKMNLKYVAKRHIASGRYDAVREIAIRGEGFLCHSKMFCYLGIDSIRRVLGLMFGVFHQRAFLRHWNCFFTNVGMVVEYGVYFRRIVLGCLLCKNRWDKVVRHLFRTTAEWKD